MLGHGTGSELRQPFGYTIVGGLIISQMMTLYTNCGYLIRHYGCRPSCSLAMAFVADRVGEMD